MHDQKYEVICELMDELKGMMEPSSDSLGERLGRPKVAVEIESESESPMDGEEFAMDGDIEGPEEKFKQRIMKLRG